MSDALNTQGGCENFVPIGEYANCRLITFPNEEVKFRHIHGYQVRKLLYAVRAHLQLPDPVNYFGF